MQQQENYPVQFTVDYPDRPLDRLTTGLRIFAAIPILIVLGAVSGETWQWSTDGNPQTATAAAMPCWCVSDTLTSLPSSAALVAAAPASRTDGGSSPPPSTSTSRQLHARS